MLGSKIDVSNMSRVEAQNYILHHCRDCENYLYCNGNDSEECNTKVKYLVEKFRIDNN